MEKYIKVIDNLKKGLSGEYLKFSLIGVMEVALEDYDSTYKIHHLLQ